MDQERRTVWQRVASVFDATVRSANPEASGRSPGATLRNVSVAVLVVALTGLAAFGWDWITAGITARHEAEIQVEIDQEQEAEQAAADDAAAAADDDATDEAGPGPEPAPSDEPAEEPFDPGIWASVEPLAPEPPGPGILLLDGLDDESVATFQSADLEAAQFDELLDLLWSEGVPRYAPFGQDPGLSNRWNVNLGSDGPAAVTVTDLDLAGLECVPARASAAFELPAQGANDRLVISYSMAGSGSGRLYEYTDAGDHAPGWGEPFFEQKVVSLGGSEETVGLVVEVVTTDQDCTWTAFELSYEGPEGGGAYEVVSDDGEPFEARGIAADADTFFMYHDEGGPDVYASPLW